ncbi:protein of unknown function [Nitrospira defluvii]|uniref:Uncharacterized protein n=1 Tax=Nitrospira defluvii TaxID=330214 RepID=D8PGX4_9BACT|nr:protein of unknown function [Nitrospira defluvii]
MCTVGRSLRQQSHKRTGTIPADPFVARRRHVAVTQLTNYAPRVLNGSWLARDRLNRRYHVE